MSYPQFNLTTLQLPAPTSNMTKAEYKATYGIDLDEVNIKAFKLVILGNEKYPIDQIKEVEDGYEIYFNGQILSITDIVQTSDEVYDVANSKPIYWHGLDLFKSGVVSIQAHVLNNSPTLIDSVAKLDAWFKSVPAVGGEVNLSITGYVRRNEENWIVWLLRKNVNNTYTIFGHVEDATQYSSFVSSTLADLITFCDDRMNKIN